MPDFGMFETMEEDRGDFSLRCLPLSLGVFRELKNAGYRGLVTARESERMDEFDAFLLKNLPFFGYFIREYYRAHEPASLQLRALGETSLLEHLDEAIERYVRSFEQKDYEVAERIFYHMLERAIVQERQAWQSL